MLFAAAEASEDNKETAWWQEPSAERERVVVDMPLSVAGIRGTFWMNEVGATGESTAVIIGHAILTSAGQAVSLGANQASTVSSASTPPTPPSAFTQSMQQAIISARDWVLQRAQEIQRSLPQPPVLSILPPNVPVLRQNLQQQQTTTIVGLVANALGNATGVTAVNTPNNTTTSTHGSSSSVIGSDTQAPEWAGGVLVPSNITANGLTLTWSGATDNVAVTGYELYKNGSQYTSLTETTYNITGLMSETKYSFNIQARDAAGNWSSDGPAIEVTTASLPDNLSPPTWAGGVLVPSNITTTALTLTWSGATDNVAVTGYELYLNGTAFASVTGSTYNVTGLTPGTLYEFSIKAVDGAGNQSSALTTTVTTAATADNQAPVWTSGAITPSSVTTNSATLSWIGATDNVAVTGYELYLNGAAFASVTGSTYNITGLTPGTTYTFKVEAGDAAGNWSSNGPTTSVTTAAATLDNQVPVWTSGAITPSSVTTNSATLSWIGATDNVAVTGYELYLNGAAFASVTGSTYNVTGLTPGTTYTFKVEAGDAAGNWSSTGPTTSVTTAATVDNQAPVWTSGAITPSSVTNNSATLSWIGATDNVAVTGYELYLNGAAFASVTGSTYNVTGLTPGTTYTFKVEAGDAAGNWSSTGPTTSVTLAATADNQPPTWAGGAISATNITANSVTLTWHGAKCHEGIDGYKLYLNGAAFAIVTGSKYNVTGLTPATSYTFRVEARNPAGHWSSRGPTILVITASLQDNQPPTWPGGGLTASNVTSNSITLSWTRATDNVAVTGYKLYMNGSQIVSVSAGTYNYTVTGLTSNTSYTFRVQAGDAVNNWNNNGPTAKVKTQRAH